ncbi:verrucotoxin subunit beta-like [Boleophthalmus pectinirostris]|uniref:verrucotoxin subunit beta-like n=1 Tax=Boleophthalmus pectinirostris TaxID=150288 RepID=UPI002430A6AE|nr:verrucotoxin subunit beta-like [Boleophthalmus pectinirostris]
MASDCDSPLEMAALGRSFLLGMFYDCRSDKLVPGLSFWDQEKLDKDMRVTREPSTECQIVVSDHLSKKASSLQVDAGLKASFLSGLVTVQGSAKYLNNKKSSSRQARVTLQYKTTTQFKTLSMNQLSEENLKHHEVIKKGLATHVVTAILYGAQAFFVFDQETSQDENVQEIQGNLKVMIEKIPNISIDAEGNLKMEDRDKEKVNKFSCTFHGDFCLDKSPTTFEEAVKVYQDLPKRLGPKGENAVPVRVHLLPLSALDSAASKLVRHISLRLVCEAENILENFRELDMICNDILKSPAGQNFSYVSEKVKTFNSLCSEFLLGLQETLATKLPSIRGGGEEEAALAEVLKRATESPFSFHRLNQWMEEVTEEANTIKVLTNLMRNTEVISSKNDLKKKVFDSEKALVFVFTSLERAGRTSKN